MGKTSNKIFTYAKPDPFITPVNEFKPQDLSNLGALGAALAALLPFDVFQHDQLMYSGPTLENVMYHISREFENRGGNQVQWKAYKTSPTDFDLFVAGGSEDRDSAFLGATTLQKYPVKFFPFYVQDIQEKIQELVSNTEFPDSIGSLMARIFLNNTTHTGATWDSQTRLPSTIVVPVSDENNAQAVSIENITPLANIATTWAFPYASDHVTGVIPRMGVDFTGKAYTNRGPLAVRTSDEPGKSNFQGSSTLQWPRSVIGQQRTEQGVTIDEGILEDREGSSVTGIDSIHVKASPGNEDTRSKQFRQVAEEDASTTRAIGQYDPQSGYSFFAHSPHVLQQLRYQPPQVETWDNTTQVRDYVENVFSNLTPNLAWYHSQPVEQLHDSDWGGWLIQGLGGLTGPGMTITAYADPQHQNIVTNCPFSVFYPPPTSTCTCLSQNTAYALWGSSTEGLQWNELTVPNRGGDRGAAKQFGPRTRLILDATFNLGAGTGSTGGAGWMLGVRTSRISSVNLQPFVPIMGQTVGGTDFGNIFSSSMSVNLMDAMASFYPGYTKTGVDSILAIGIFVQTKTGESQVVDAVDGPGGSFIPPTDLGCAVGTSTATCRKLYLYEPPYEGSSDPRLPPALDHGTIVAPPTYNLPIVS